MVVLLEFRVNYLLQNLFSLLPHVTQISKYVVTKKYFSQWNIEIIPNCLQVRDNLASY